MALAGFQLFPMACPKRLHSLTTPTCGAEAEAWYKLGLAYGILSKEAESKGMTANELVNQAIDKILSAAPVCQLCAPLRSNVRRRPQKSFSTQRLH